jgi:hypothetical protein
VGGTVLSYDDVLLDALNRSAIYDASNLIQELINDGEGNNEYINFKTGSLYYDASSFISKFKNNNNPIILSLNIQSLQSKYNELKLFILELLTHNIKIDIIALQLPTDRRRVKTPPVVSICGVCTHIYM